MKYKVKKEHRKEFCNKVYILRVGDILEYHTGTYIFKTIQQWIEYSRTEIENNPDYFELIQEKMTWEKIEDVIFGAIFGKEWQLDDIRALMLIIKEHCILKDDINTIQTVITQATIEAIIKSELNKWLETNKAKFKWFEDYADFVKNLGNNINDMQ